MLIPLYVLGFIFGGVVLFVFARRVHNRKAKIALKTIGILAGPIFFLIVAVFSGWVRERTYEVGWLTGDSAAKYLDPGKESTRQNRDVVVLRRFVGGNDCYEAFISQELADYLRGLPTQTVQVQYIVTYDFLQFRTYTIKKIGNLPYRPDASSWITAGNHIGGACFRW